MSTKDICLSAFKIRNLEVIILVDNQSVANCYLYVIFLRNWQLNVIFFLQICMITRRPFSAFQSINHSICATSSLIQCYKVLCIILVIMEYFVLNLRIYSIQKNTIIIHLPYACIQLNKQR